MAKARMLRNRTEGPLFIREDFNRHTILDVDGHRIAVVHGRGDAQMFAAAPDLESSLERMLMVFRDRSSSLSERYSALAEAERVLRFSGKISSVISADQLPRGLQAEGEAS